MGAPRSEVLAGALGVPGASVGAGQVLIATGTVTVSAQDRRPEVGGAAGGGRKRRKRSVITEEIKAKVKALLAQEKTGAEVAKVIGISLPSVQNIKKELGLVKKRKG